MATAIENIPPRIKFKNRMMNDRSKITQGQMNSSTFSYSSSGPGGGEGTMPRGMPSPVKIIHKKMATEFSRIDFMFLARHPAAGSATVLSTLTKD